MLLARNFLAGLTSGVWSVLLTLLTVPIYLHYLGIEAYGLVGVFVFSQSVLQLLDFGLAPTIAREVARCRSLGTMESAAELLRMLSVFYWAVGALIFLGFYFAAPFIANHWLNAEGLSSDTVVSATVLIGIVIACRWPLGLYQGVLIGAEKITTSSAVNILMTGIAGIGAICVLAFVSRTIEAFFIWQAVVGLCYSVVLSVIAWNTIGRQSGKAINWKRFKDIWRFSVGMSFVAVSAIILMQIDKAFLSRLLSLSEFGQYMLAVLISGSLYLLLRPLFNVIYPRMSALVANGEHEKLREFYSLGTRILCAFLFPMAATIAAFSIDFVHLWTQDAAIAQQVGPLVTLLLIGSALNGVMHFPYALQLASGAARLPLMINSVLIMLYLPMIFLLTRNFGALGGAGAWAVLNCLYLLLGTWLTHRVLLKNEGLRWLLRDVLMPLCVTVLVVVGIGTLVRSGDYNYLVNLTFAMLLAACAVAINLLMMIKLVPRMRLVLN